MINGMKGMACFIEKAGWSSNSLILNEKKTDTNKKTALHSVQTRRYYCRVNCSSSCIANTGLKHMLNIDFRTCCNVALCLMWTQC